MKTPYRAANLLMQSVDELRLVRGFTPEIVEKLRPWITALPQPTEINVNTASKDVLGALFYTSLPPSLNRSCRSGLTNPRKISAPKTRAGGRRQQNNRFIWH